MSLIKKLFERKAFRDLKMLELYPPFLFMGIKVREVSPDHRHLRVELPFRWYSKNIHGTMFGGLLAAVADPMPAMMCAQIFPEIEVWTKGFSIDFLRPGTGKLTLKIDIEDEQVEEIRAALGAKSSTLQTFHFSFWDEAGREIARVANTVFLRERKRPPQGKPPKEA